LGVQMTVNKSYLNALEKLIGVLLVLTGFGFWSLLTIQRERGELAGDLKVSTFLLCAGAVLVWLGFTCLFSKQRPHEGAQHGEFNHYLFKLRRPIEFCAAVGLILTVLRAIALLHGAECVPAGLEWALFSAPVLIGLFQLRILTPGASQCGPFPDDVVRRWSSRTRKLVRLLLQIGWLGYPAGALFWGFRGLTPWTERMSVRFAALTLISLLYASQVLVLHLGQMRRTGTEG
jgi:hypothetical protein